MDGNNNNDNEVDDKPFLMPIEDVFTISGHGTIAAGRIERGRVKVGDEIEIIGMSESIRKTVCTGVEMFKKSVESGQAGETVGILLRGIERTALQRGQVLAKPGSIKPHTKFKADVYMLSKKKDGAGRHVPFFENYRPQFYIRTTDVTGGVTLPPGVEMVMPGDNVQLGVALITPVAVEVGWRFAIREEGQTVGTGTVISLIE